MIASALLDLTISSANLTSVIMPTAQVSMLLVYLISCAN